MADLSQTQHSLKRNYPVLANFRWLQAHQAALECVTVADEEPLRHLRLQPLNLLLQANPWLLLRRQNLLHPRDAVAVAAGGAVTKMQTRI